MYIQIISGWRYKPGMRAKTRSQVERIRSNSGGVSPLMPDAPGLLARVWGTDPRDSDTGVAIWVWESKAASDAFQFPWEGDPLITTPLDARMDFSKVEVQCLDGMYLALAPDFLRHALGHEVSNEHTPVYER
jgi:hypothetical protein